ncbi:amidohydrolase family protein [Daejeonella sp.]|uniref:amidohydrolase family protein n=1 Tax=Daejeonella sp. TaxID=2805397 RepID=UPI0027B8DF9C|nr:amidohydrolase family protein [Daejeonella sp.]
MTIKSLLIVLTALITPDWEGKNIMPSTEHIQIKQERYYTVEDFKSLKKFDTHIHINTNEITFVKLAQEDNFQFLDIVDDRPFGLPWTEQQKFALLHLKNFPDQMEVATTFSVKGFNDKGWADNTIKDLKLALSKGAKAVKIWKNIGMDLKDRNGQFVMLDHPRIQPILDYLEDNKIPLIGHNGEPRDCWLPLDKMTFSQSYYSSHPEYHMYLHPEYPSYEDHIRARDNMLEKHPNLKFVGAHLGSLEWSLDELAKRLDKYPNMSVDLSRISNLQLHTLNDRQKTRNFFIKYQDRLVYGTDKAINASANPAELKKSIHDAWLRDWIFFATDSRIQLTGFGELNGLKLPRTVIDKIYRKNAENWLSNTPSEIKKN